MTTDYRALCAELVDALDSGIPAGRIRMSPLADRARALLDQQDRQPLVAGEVVSYEDICQWLGQQAYWGDNAHLIPRVANIVRDAIIRWGCPTPQPVPVSERLPGPKDCDAEGRCWLEFEGSDDYEPCWTLRKMYGIPFNTTHWLPANALPAPEATND